MEINSVLLICVLMGICVAAGNEEVPFPENRMTEIMFSGGVPDATNQFDNSHWTPQNGFRRGMPVGNGWHSGPSGNPPPLPLYVWYDFKSEGFRPAEVSFQPTHEKQPNRAPSSYQFVGTNDAVCNDDSIWTLLCEDLSDREWRNHFEVRYCKVKPEVRTKFRCLGIRLLVVRQDGWAGLRNIRMWQRI